MASWRYRPLNPIFTGAPSYSTGRRSRASPRSGLFVETSSCFPENESRMLFTLSGAMTLTRFRTSTNAPRGDVRDDPVLLGDDLPVIREIRVEKPDPHLRVPLSGEKELLRGGHLQGARPPRGPARRGPPPPGGRSRCPSVATMRSNVFPPSSCFSRRTPDRLYLVSSPVAEGLTRSTSFRTVSESTATGFPFARSGLPR